MNLNPSIRKVLLLNSLILFSLSVLAFRSQPEKLPPTFRTAQPVMQKSMPPAPDMTPLTTEENAAQLVEAIIQVESGGDPRKVGRHGERGLMQIRSGTWRDMTTRLFGSPRPFSQAFDPELNRRVGTAYLAWLQRGLLPRQSEWQMDERSLLLAAYNAGPGRLRKARFNLAGMPRQTRDYVARASALHDRIAGDQSRILAAPDRTSTDS